MRLYPRIPSLIIIFLLLSIQSLFAQRHDSLRLDMREQEKEEDFVRRMKRIGEEETIRSIEAYKSAKLSNHQRITLNKLVDAMRQAKSYLEQRVVDTNQIEKNLTYSREVLKIASEGVLINKGSIQTQRNLAVSATIFNELLENTLSDKAKVDNHANRLYHFKETIDSLYSDTTLYAFPGDSLAVEKYLSRLVVVAKEITPVDSAVSRSLASVQDIQPRVDLLVHELRAALEEVSVYQKAVSTVSIEREIPNIWEPARFSRPFWEIAQYSFLKVWLGFKFYLSDHLGVWVFIILLVIAGGYYLRSLRQIAIEHSKVEKRYDLPLSLRFPFLTAAFVGLNIFQFLFLDPPLSFSSSIWLLQCVCLTVLFYRHISAYWMKFWIVFQTLTVLAIADNMLLQASRPERWFMAGLSVTGTAYSIYIILKGKHDELRERGVLYFVFFVAAFEFVSLIFNITGRYNIAKTLMVSGFAGIIIAICFLWTTRLVNEILSLSSTLYRQTPRKSLYINFDKVGDKVPKYFYVLLAIGWLILVGRNFYYLKELGNSINNYITRETTIGSYSFSIRNLLIFFLVMGCSLIASRLVSYFATDTEAQHSGEKKSKRMEIGSWILLIRIFIISIGVFLAFAATGIPLDKITIILGALGVGIGLGLQTLVNNLVSGLIIAFEKPVNVGDTIEINGKPGIMKSIGFRSSVLRMFDGSHLIVPNGDLLDGQLVNWSSGKNIRRASVILRVAYGTDLDKVKSILLDVVASNDRVLQYPPPSATATAITNNAVDFELLFWVASLRDFGDIKGEVIFKVVNTFREAGITIPSNQQDIYIKGLVNDPSKQTRQDSRKEISE